MSIANRIFIKFRVSLIAKLEILKHISYLVDGISKLIVVVVERCIDLCFAPSTQDPYDLLIIVSLVGDLLVKYLSFCFCQCHVHLISLITERTNKRN